MHRIASGSLLWIVLAMTASLVSATAAASDVRVAPDPWLAVDRNRAAIVDSIVVRWRAAPAFAASGERLREALGALRADELFAASLAGSENNLLDVLTTSGAWSRTATGRVNAKAAPVNPELAYTPITPCRIVDTRGGAGGTLAAGDTRSWLATNPGGSFASQGGSSGSCGIPVKAAAVTVNITVFNTGPGPAFLASWPFNQPQPNTATINWTAAGSQVANGAVLPLCRGAGCTADFNVYTTMTTDMIVDVVGYFTPPTGDVVVHVAPSGAQFTSIQAAIDAAAALATASQPYLVKVAPGTYTERVTTKNFVSVEGSGQLSTIVTWGANPGTLTTGSTSEVRNLTIRNTFNGTFTGSPPGGGNAVVQNAANAIGTFISNSYLLAQGPGENISIIVNSGPLAVARSVVETIGSVGLQIGVFTDGNGGLAVRDSRISVPGGAGTPRTAVRDGTSGLSIAFTGMFGGPTEGTPLCYGTFTVNLADFTCN